MRPVIALRRTRTYNSRICSRKNKKNVKKHASFFYCIKTSSPCIQTKPNISIKFSQKQIHPILYLKNILQILLFASICLLLLSGILFSRTVLIFKPNCYKSTYLRQNRFCCFIEFMIHKSDHFRKSLPQFLLYRLQPLH